MEHLDENQMAVEEDNIPDPGDRCAGFEDEYTWEEFVNKINLMDAEDYIMDIRANSDDFRGEIKKNIKKEAVLHISFSLFVHRMKCFVFSAFDAWSTRLWLLQIILLLVSLNYWTTIGILAFLFCDSFLVFCMSNYCFVDYLFVSFQNICCWCCVERFCNFFGKGDLSKEGKGLIWRYRYRPHFESVFEYALEVEYNYETWFYKCSKVLVATIILLACISLHVIFYESTQDVGCHYYSPLNVTSTPPHEMYYSIEVEEYSIFSFLSKVYSNKVLWEDNEMTRLYNCDVLGWDFLNYYKGMVLGLINILILIIWRICSYDGPGTKRYSRQLQKLRDCNVRFPKIEVGWSDLTSTNTAELVQDVMNLLHILKARLNDNSNENPINAISEINAYSHLDFGNVEKLSAMEIGFLHYFFIGSLDDSKLQLEERKSITMRMFRRILRIAIKIIGVFDIPIDGHERLAHSEKVEPDDRVNILIGRNDDMDQLIDLIEDDHFDELPEMNLKYVAKNLIAGRLFCVLCLCSCCFCGMAPEHLFNGFLFQDLKTVKEVFRRKRKDIKKDEFEEEGEEAEGDVKDEQGRKNQPLQPITISDTLSVEEVEIEEEVEGEGGEEEEKEEANEGGNEISSDEDVSEGEVVESESEVGESSEEEAESSEEVESESAEEEGESTEEECESTEDGKEESESSEETEEQRKERIELIHTKTTFDYARFFICCCGSIDWCMLFLKSFWMDIIFDPDQKRKTAIAARKRRRLELVIQQGESENSCVADEEAWEDEVNTKAMLYWIVDGVFRDVYSLGEFLATDAAKAFTKMACWLWVLVIALVVVTESIIISSYFFVNDDVPSFLPDDLAADSQFTLTPSHAAYPKWVEERSNGRSWTSLSAIIRFSVYSVFLMFTVFGSLYILSILVIFSDDLESRWSRFSFERIFRRVTKQRRFYEMYGTEFIFWNICCCAIVGKNLRKMRALAFPKKKEEKKFRGDRDNKKLARKESKLTRMGFEWLQTEEKREAVNEADVNSYDSFIFVLRSMFSLIDFFCCDALVIFVLISIFFLFFVSVLLVGLPVIIYLYSSMLLLFILLCGLLTLLGVGCTCCCGVMCSFYSLALIFLGYFDFLAYWYACYLSCGLIRLWRERGNGSISREDVWNNIKETMANETTKVDMRRRMIVAISIFFLVSFSSVVLLLLFFLLGLNVLFFGCIAAVALLVCIKTCFRCFVYPITDFMGECTDNLCAFRFDFFTQYYKFFFPSPEKEEIVQVEDDDENRPRESSDDSEVIEPMGGISEDEAGKSLEVIGDLGKDILEMERKDSGFGKKALDKVGSISNILRGKFNLDDYPQQKKIFGFLLGLDKYRSGNKKLNEKVLRKIILKMREDRKRVNCLKEFQKTMERDLQILDNNPFDFPSIMEADTDDPKYDDVEEDGEEKENKDGKAEKVEEEEESSDEEEGEEEEEEVVSDLAKNLVHLYRHKKNENAGGILRSPGFLKDVRKLLDSQYEKSIFTKALEIADENAEEMGLNIRSTVIPNPDSEMWEVKENIIKMIDSCKGFMGTYLRDYKHGREFCKQVLRLPIYGNNAHLLPKSRHEKLLRFYEIPFEIPNHVQNFAWKYMYSGESVYSEDDREKITDLKKEYSKNKKKKKE